MYATISSSFFKPSTCINSLYQHKCWLFWKLEFYFPCWTNKALDEFLPLSGKTYSTDIWHREHSSDMALYKVNQHLLCNSAHSPLTSATGRAKPNFDLGLADAAKLVEKLGCMYRIQKLCHMHGLGFNKGASSGCAIPLPVGAWCSE